MTIGDIRKAIKNLDDDLVAVIDVPIEDEDGDTVVRFFSMQKIAREMEPDTAEWYARVACAPVDDE